MKRFYTVKEAASILGFSTNTIYKYLAEGKLKTKRIGRGRFKIPYEELSPFLSPGEKIEHVIEEKTHGDKIADALKDAESEFKGIASERKDFIFFRLFLGIELLGAGLTNLFWQNGFLLSGLPKVLSSLSLIGGGGLSILVSLYWKKSKRFNLVSHILTLFLLFLASVIAIIGKNYPLGIFLGVFIFLLLTHLMRGFENCCETATFKKEFIFFSFIATTLMGLLALANPEILTISFLSQFVATQKISFAILWFGIIVFPFGYLLFSRKESSNFFFWVYGLNSITAFLAASGASTRAVWDLAFGAFIYGIFAMFLLWWTAKGVELEETEFHIVIASFLWVALAVVLGLIAIQDFQRKLIDATAERMRTTLSGVTQGIDLVFTELDSIVDAETKKQDLANIILTKDKERAVLASKIIYGESGNLRRVFFMDNDGIALGVYPRNVTVEGTNFSSRDYFQISKTSLRPYVSNMFQTILNIWSVVEAIPVFKGNQFVGVTVLTPDLAKISEKSQSPASGGNVYAFDEKGRYALNPDKDKIGQEVERKIIAAKDEPAFQEQGRVVRVYDWAATPRWTIYLERDAVSLLEKTSNINDIVSVVIVVNAAVSLGAAFTLAKKWKSI